MNVTSGDGRWSMLLIGLFAAATLAGCQSKLISLEGTIATQHDSLALKPDGPHSGQWQSADVIVDYSYAYDANRILIEGTATLAPRLTKSFTIARRFSLRANLLDGDKKILKSMVIVAVGAVPIGPWRFKQGTSLPTEVEAMNFSYTGAVREHGSPAGGIGSSFWKVP